MSLTAEQLADRHTSLGASEIAAVVGLSPWKSAHDVWLSKMQLVEEGSSTASRIGNLIEPLLLQLYKEDTGSIIANFGTVKHPTKPWASATPDGCVYGVPRLVEAKAVGWRMVGHWTSEDDGVPDYYRAQSEWQCLVTGAEEVDFSVLLGGTDYRVYRVKRDRELGGMLLESGEKFWRDHVMTGTPPAADHSEGARRMLKALYPTNRKPIVPAPAEANEVVEKLFATKHQIAVLDRQKDGLENRLRELIADHDGIRGREFLATFRADRNGKRVLRVNSKEAA